MGLAVRFCIVVAVLAVEPGITQKVFTTSILIILEDRIYKSLQGILYSILI